MVGSEVYSSEIKKTEVLMENFRRAIGKNEPTLWMFCVFVIADLCSVTMLRWMSSFCLSVHSEKLFFDYQSKERTSAAAFLDLNVIVIEECVISKNTAWKIWFMPNWLSANGANKCKLKLNKWQRWKILHKLSNLQPNVNWYANVVHVLTIFAFLHHICPKQICMI